VNLEEDYMKLDLQKENRNNPLEGVSAMIKSNLMCLFPSSIENLL